MISDKRARTADGAEVEVGMAMWNCDLRLDWVVAPHDEARDWFVTELGWVVDSATMCKRHPVTGQLADDAAQSNASKLF